VRATKHAREGGRSVYFCPLAEIVDSLARADREGRLRERIRYLCRAQLLIIDEIGYLSVGAAAGNLFFQLINARYEKGAMILTSNRGFAEWGEVFGNAVVATALLVHRAGIVNSFEHVTRSAAYPSWSSGTAWPWWR
jgi:DNA replication protein DnaC